MDSCPACGGSTPPAARWCGQCYAEVGRLEPAVATSAALSAGTAPVAATTTILPVHAPTAGPPPSMSLLPPTSPGGRSDGTLLSHRAILLVAVAIGVGAAGMGLSWALGRDQSIEPEAYIRYAIVITVAVYAVVGALIVTRLVPGVRLAWVRGGSPAGSILLGALVGGGLSAGLLAVVSGAAGHLSPDPRIVTMMSEGDPAHLVVCIGITCLCAPLVEEVLFRGLLLESLRRHGTRVAVAGSGLAFAVWHLNPSALRYYALMGALLGAIYLKRGLAGSIAAHVAFNGVLTVAALAVVLAPSTVVTAGRVSLSVPGGWSRTTATGVDLALDGPSGSMLLVVDVPTDQPPSTTEVSDRIRRGLLTQVFPAITVDAGSVREVRLPAGDAVEVEVSAQGHRGTVVFLPQHGESVDLVFLNGGSPKAQHDFTELLASLRVS